jgi:hypothetical protein
VKLLSWADDHPILATSALAVAIFIGLRAWSCLSDAPVLLAGADPDQRVTIYGQIANSAVGILGISLTVLAILIALPDRPTISDVRSSDTWPRLQGLLLTIALLALIALVTAQVGAATDNGKDGLEWLEQVMLSAVSAATVALIVAGLTFWLVLREANSPDDPSRGRGEGKPQGR